jgi:YHYH protein
MSKYGYTVATDASSAVKVFTSSYRTKTTPDTNRPATTTTYAIGTFTQD